MICGKSATLKKLYKFVKINFMMVKKISLGVLALAFMFTVVAPVSVLAQSNTFSYQPRTVAEKVAYLYGRISQLLEIKQQLENSGQSEVSSSFFNTITLDTHSAADKTSNSAILRGEVLLSGEATAKVWFEYGEESDFLDQKTRQSSVSSAYNRAVRVSVTRLKEDQRYYFRIAASDKEGVVYYGSVFAFRTDESDDN